MIILISGATHTGKTLLAQKLLEKYRYPYLSQDHLKMGLIRSKNTELTVYDDEALTPYLWNITREIIKTAVENKQNLIIEGCYIPFDWQKDFSRDYLKNIKYICLIMTEKYIENNFDIIKEKMQKDPLEVFTEALNNVMPVLEVKARRVGGATYQVPLEIRPERRQTLGLRWLVRYARTRNEKSMAVKLAAEIMDAVAGNGGAFKKKEDMHKMAEANKAFAHYKF
jgi:ribosomal protein S7